MAYVMLFINKLKQKQYRSKVERESFGCREDP